MARRKPNPKVDLGPDYALKCTGVATGSKAPTDYVGCWYAGMTDGGYSTWRMTPALAVKLKGPGLASAERALMRRGYITQRVQAGAEPHGNG